MMSGRKGLLCLLVIGFVFPSALFSETTTEVPLTEEAYFAALHAADEETFTREFECPFVVLLDEKQQKVYKKLDDLKKRKASLAYYWSQWNPNPLLPENEYLVGFLERLRYVREHFSNPRQPYFDDRGKYYLKYGKPTSRYTQGLETKRVEFFKDEEIIQFITEKQGDGRHVDITNRPLEVYTVLPNESWLYRWEGEGMEEAVIHFVGEGSYFREIENLDAAVASKKRVKEKYWYWADLAKKRAYTLQAKDLISTVQEIEEFEKQILMAMDYQEWVVNVTKPQFRLQEKERNFQLAATIAKEQLPPTVYVAEDAVQDLSFHDEIAQFRGPNRTTRLNVRFLTPFDENDLERAPLTLEYSLLFQDEAFRPLLEERMECEAPSSSHYPNAVGHVSVNPKPQSGQLALQVMDSKTGRIGYAKRAFQVRDFGGSRLALSDIELFMEVADSTGLASLPVAYMDGRSVTPYPFQRIRKSNPVLCYFEVYNLMKSGVLEEYEISIRIALDESRGGLLKRVADVITGRESHSMSVSHFRPVYGDDSVELIGVDLSQLADGAYTLEITVTGVQNDAITATTQKDLWVVE